MSIEERIALLENTAYELQNKINYLEKKNSDKWVSAKELAEIMSCSVNNIYIKVRSGEIYATKRLGSSPKIPMSQFYKDKETEERSVAVISNMKGRVFE